MKAGDWVCVDVDGTIDANPPVFQFLLDALHAAGAQIAILTGLHGVKSITPADVQAKHQRLQELGIGSYAQLVVFPDDGTLAQAKAAWIEQHGAAMLIDNSRANAQAAQDHCLVLVPWATRMGKKGDG